MPETHTYIHILKNIITRNVHINRMWRKRRYAIKHTYAGINAYVYYDIYLVFCVKNRRINKAACKFNT